MKGLHVLVLGLGESGLAMARWCLREGARVRVADSREAPPDLGARSAALTGVDIVLGSFTEALLDGIGLVAISPGLSPNGEPQATLLIEARAAGIPVCSEIELFARKLATLNADEGYAPRVVGITGTNGKTTVTRLVGAMCRAAGRATVVAGNVSPAALDALADARDARDAARLPDVWVLELSSFQLETTKSLAADAATVLNVTEDHLDWHGDFASYVRAKAAIFAPRTVRVLNRDDAVVLGMDALGETSVRFGLDAPTVAGDLGIVADRGRVDEPRDGLRWIAVAEGDDPDAEATGGRRVPASRRRAARPTAAVDVRVKRLMPVDALRIRGDHNVANVLAAIALGRAIGLPMAAMLRAAAAYRGEPHRVSLVLAHGGVDWIDDSKGTNVGATVAALRGLGRKVVLIAGGLGKGQDFAPLATPVALHARAVLLIGRDRDALRGALEETGVDLVDCASLDDAVEHAATIAEPGDAVLLSPACASQDMFRDYAHRADVFVAAVRRVAALTTAEAVPC